MIPSSRASRIWASFWSIPNSLACGCNRLRSLAKEPPISPNPMTTTFISKSLYRFCDFFFLYTEGKPDVPRSLAAKNGPWGHKNIPFVQQLVHKAFRVQGTLGQLGPEEHAHGIGIVSTAQGIGQLEHQFPSSAIDPVQGLEPSRPAFQRHCGPFCDAVEHPGIHLALDLEDGIDVLGAAQDNAHAPTRHIEGLAQGVELQTAVLGPFDAQEALGVLAQYKAVGIVVYQ